MKLTKRIVIKRNLFLLFILFYSNLHFGQLNKNIPIAEGFYSNKKYYDCSALYVVLFEQDKINASTHADIYRHGIDALIRTNKYKSAKFAFETLSLSEKYTFEDAYNHIKLLFYLGELKDAKKISQHAVITASADARREKIEKFIQHIGIDENSTKPLDYQFDYEFYKGFYDGFAIDYFVSAKKNLKGNLAIKESPWLEISNQYEPHFIYNNDKGKYVKNKKLKIKKHSGAAFFDSLGSTWYYTKGVNIKSTPMSSSIFSFLETTKKEQQFSYNRGDHFNAHPSLSDNRQILWFTSNREGGIGGMDLWYCVRDQTGWGEPINAGSPINTEKDEMFPFEHDGKLYYASNGHTNVGGLDLYEINLDKIDDLKGYSFRRPLFPNRENLSTNETSEFSEEFSQSITNRGYADNQNQYLFDFLTFEQSGKLPKKYNIKTGKPEDEIVLNEKIELNAVLKDKETGEIIKDSPVEIIEVASSDTLEVKTNKQGEVSTELERNKEYEIMTEKEGYDPVMAKVETKEKVNEIVENLEIRKTPEAPMVRMESILYNFNQYNLSAIGIAELDTLVSFLKENKEVTVEISSHTDCRGTDAYNLNLSSLRGKTCINYLLSKGIKKERFIVKNYGESKLLNQCKDGIECPEDLHQINRRTEFVIMFPQ